MQIPKSTQGESESDTGVFTPDCFGKVACLAQSPQSPQSLQSPQLYEQMHISSDTNMILRFDLFLEWNILMQDDI